MIFPVRSSSQSCPNFDTTLQRPLHLGIERHIWCNEKFLCFSAICIIAILHKNLHKFAWRLPHMRVLQNRIPLYDGHRFGVVSIDVAFVQYLAYEFRCGENGYVQCFGVY